MFRKAARRGWPFEVLDYPDGSIHKNQMYCFLMYIRPMKTNSQLFRGSLTTIVLKLLSEEDKMYGYKITKKVKDLSEGNLLLTEGALYPALHKLEADGLVQATIEHVGNRPRKYYSLTKHGKKETKIKLEELNSFIGQMQTLLNLKPGII